MPIDYFILRAALEKNNYSSTLNVKDLWALQDIEQTNSIRLIDLFPSDLKNRKLLLKDIDFAKLGPVLKDIDFSDCILERCSFSFLQISGCNFTRSQRINCNTY